MFAALRGEKLYVVATISDSKRLNKIVARRDKGIAGPEDLDGKTIGLIKGTASEYLLHELLTYYRVNGDRIRVVDMQPREMIDALAKGTIDGAVTFEPYISVIQQRLGANCITIENESVYTLFFNLVTGQDFITTHSETAKKVLRALVAAQRYIEENPAAVQKIITTYVGEGAYKPGDVNFDVRLGQELVIELEDQARWAISHGLTDRKDVPNFERLMYVQAMEAVTPDSVTVPLDRRVP